MKTNKIENCPVTGLKFFMSIENEAGDFVDTFGGPYDSYTTPIVDDTSEGEYCWERFCHDRGCWMGFEQTPNHLIKLL